MVNFATLRTQEQVEQTHEAALQILEQVGMLVRNEKARAYLKNYGCKFDPDSEIVRFPRAVVEEMRTAIPAKFTLYGREPQYDCTIPDDRPVIITGSSAPFILDPVTGHERRSYSDDIARIAYLVNELLGYDVFSISTLALQCAQAMTAVVFDKTGTLTRGAPELTDVVALGATATETELLRAAAAVEKLSEHPLADAVVRGAAARGLAVPPAAHFKSVTGKGVRAMVEGREVVVGNRALMAELRFDLGAAGAPLADLEAAGKTAVLVGVEGRLAGIVAVADTVKEHARAAVDALRRMGRRVVMMSGDNRRDAEAIGRQVGIDRVLAEVQACPS